MNILTKHIIVAIDLSAQGHALLLLSRRVDIMEKLNLPDTICEPVDVTDLESYRKAVEKAEVKYGPTELLINNSGVIYRFIFKTNTRKIQK